jgi:hypothetical protein
VSTVPIELKKFIQSARRPEKLLSVKLSTVEAKPILWLWKQRLACSTVAILAGHPGLGKSTLALDIGARVTCGGKWPCKEGDAPLGKVIILSAEDDVATTIRPRFEAAGGDVGCCHVIEAVECEDGTGRRGFDLQKDLERLAQLIEIIGDVKLIIIDPISAYLGGKIDSHRNTDVRAVLAPLQDLASRCGATILGVSHLTKSGSNQAISRVTGSGAFVAAARSAWLVERDADDGKRRLFLPIKNNLGVDSTGFAFSIVEKRTTDSGLLYAAAVEWEDAPVATTANEALAAVAEERDGRKSESAEAAKKMLRDMLANGPVLVKTIEARAKELGIGDSSLRTAKKALCGPAHHRPDGAWEWSLIPF